MVYMSSVLEMYDNLINSMLKAQPTTSPASVGDTARREASGDIRMQLNSLLEKVRDLRREYYQEEDQFRKRLKAVRHVQVETH